MSYRESPKHQPPPSIQEFAPDRRIHTEAEYALTPATMPEVAPVTKARVRKLLAERHEQDWQHKTDIRSTIHARDILEYAAVRNMAGVLLETSEKLAHRVNGGGYTRQRTEELFGQSITRFRPNLSQKQQYVLEQAKNNILDDIDTFNIWAQAQTPETLASLLDEIFPMVDPQHLRLDTQRFPGAMLVEVTNPETFRQIRVGEKTQGFYNPDLGEGLLKGRILVVNVSEEINEDIARHEYQHFLFAHAADELEFVPEVSKRKAIAQTQKDAHMFHSKRKKLQNTLMETSLDAEDEHAEIGVVTPETAQKLSIITSQLKELPQQESIKHTAREVAFGTYPDGPIRRAFHTFRNEMMAYSTGEATQLRFDAYFGKTLETAAQDPYYEQFKVEVELVKGLLQFALRKGVSLKQLGYVVGCSRNMQQAAKYIYLETRRVANDLDA